MKASVENNLFRAYGVGTHGEVKLSHLQFVDDTLIIGEKCWLNVRTIRDVLLILEEVSGLKVNFNKCWQVLIFLQPGCQKWLQCCIVELVRFLFCIWGCLLVEIVGNSVFGNLWLIELLLVCHRGIISSCRLVAVWFF